VAETEKTKTADALAEQPAPATADELAATEHHGHADEELAASLTNANGYTLSTANTTRAVTTGNCFEPETVIADTLLTETGSLDNTQTETVLAESQGKGAGKRAAQNEEEAAATAIAAKLPTAETAGSAATENVSQAETVIAGKLLAEHDAADDAVADKKAAAEYHEQTNTIPAERRAATIAVADKSNASESAEIATRENVANAGTSIGEHALVGHVAVDEAVADIDAMRDCVQSLSEISLTAGDLGHTEATAAETQAAPGYAAREVDLDEAALDAREAGAAEFVKQTLTGCDYGPDLFAVMGTPIAEEMDFYPGQVAERVSVDKAYKEILNRRLELAEQDREIKEGEYEASVKCLQTAHNILVQCYNEQRRMTADDVKHARVAEDIRQCTKNLEGCRAAFLAATADHMDASRVEMLALRDKVMLINGAAEQDMLAGLAQAHADRNSIDAKLPIAMTDAANAQHDGDAEKEAVASSRRQRHDFLGLITRAEKRNADGTLKPREDIASRIAARREEDLASTLAHIDSLRCDSGNNFASCSAPFPLSVCGIVIRLDHQES
jgi:hypothetical protein